MGDLVLARDDETGETGLRPVVRTYETPGLEVFELVVAVADGDTDSYTVTYEHPFWVADTGWISASELVPGDRLVTAQGETATVLDRGVTAHATTVHNVEVEELHTYFVGDLGVWVHNTSGSGNCDVDEAGTPNEVGGEGHEGTVPKPPRGKGSVPKAQRDPKRVWNSTERKAKRAAQADACPGCDKKIDASNSHGHHKKRHADGGQTVNENHIEVCHDCHKKIHAP